MSTQTTAAAYVPEHLERWQPGSGASSWDSAANYAGADLSDCYLAPIHKTRDTADALTLSNWRVISAELDNLIQHECSGEATIGHWACGWYAIYLIHESDSEALECADDWARSLSDYPVANEDDWSELEYESMQEDWDRYGFMEWRGVVLDALVEYGPEDDAEGWADEMLDKVDYAKIGELWWEISNGLGVPWESHSDGTWFNIEEGRTKIDTADLETLLGLPRGTLLPPEQQWRREPYPWPGAEPSPLVPPLPGAP